MCCIKRRCDDDDDDDDDGSGDDNRISYYLLRLETGGCTKTTKIQKKTVLTNTKITTKRTQLQDPHTDVSAD